MRITLCALLVLGLASCAAPVAQPGSSTSPTPPPAATVSPIPSVAWVVYFARDLATPMAVTIAGSPPGPTAELRLRQRMLLLAAAARSRDGGAFNVLPGMKAQLATVTVTTDLAVLDFSVPDGDWGIDGSAMLRAFVQQVVYTASEEPGIVRVLMTQNGGRQAVVGGEGLVISEPQTRAGLGYEGLMPGQAARVIRMSVTGARPLLIPNAVPEDWRATVRTTADSFSVTYADPTGAKTLTLAIALSNIPLPGVETAQKAPRFHGDARSLYQVAFAPNPRSERWLVWTEAGDWSRGGSAGVPYLLSATGLTDVEFWRFANSLHPNQI